MTFTRTERPTAVPLGPAAVEALRQRIQGLVLRPGERGYDEARRVWNGMIDRRPALIARCTEVADVRAAVAFAREHELTVAVRGGGHSVAGQSTCDDGLVIDLSPMRAVRVDAERRTARVAGGALWGDVDRETQRFGLATPGGVVSTTGVAGLTLGGGYGWLRRKHGLSCDNLLAAEVVTADGRVLTASASEHAELLWGLKGGGGNFGIVTHFDFQLHPVGPEIFYAAALYPAEQAPEILQRWRDFVAGAPDEVTSDATIWSVPPDPELPPELHGKATLLVDAVYAGPVAEGERVLRPLRQLGEPLLDLTGPQTYVGLNSALDALFPAGEVHCYWKSLYLDELVDEAIEAIAEWSAKRPSPRSLVPIRHLGGAVAGVGSADTALGDRGARFLLSIDAAWDDAVQADENIAWTRSFWADMHRFSSGATYFNFPGLLEEGEDLVRTSFGPNYDRLRALKREYDPTNLFRLNHNVEPA